MTARAPVHMHRRSGPPAAQRPNREMWGRPERPTGHVQRSGLGRKPPHKTLGPLPCLLGRSSEPLPLRLHRRQPRQLRCQADLPHHGSLTLRLLPVGGHRPRAPNVRPKRSGARRGHVELDSFLLQARVATEEGGEEVVAVDGATVSAASAARGRADRECYSAESPATTKRLPPRLSLSLSSLRVSEPGS